MTVETTEIKVFYEGNGLNTIFPVPFRIPPTDKYLFVMVIDKHNPYGHLTTDFVVDGINTDAVSIIYPRPGSDQKPLAEGEKLLIFRRLPVQQYVRLQENGAFHASTHEGKFDWLCMTDQQLQEELDRCLKVSMVWEGDVPSADEFMAIMEEYARRAEKAANRAEDAAAWVEAVYKLPGQTANIRWSWLATQDYPADSEIPLKVYYYPGRHMLYLNYNSMPCVPAHASLTTATGYQYEEVGELKELSNTIKLNFDVKAGDLLDAWVISSITQEQFDQIFASMDRVLEAAERAEEAARRAEEAASFQELAGQTVNAVSA